MSFQIYRAKEQDLIKRCLGRDRVAQQQLFDLYSSKMYGLCYRYVKNAMEAEDVLVTAFTKIFERIGQYKGEGSFEGWIRRIIIHTCINNLKKNKRFNESVDLIHATSIQVKEETIPSIIQAKQVVECIRLLPIGYRTVLNLYAIEGFSHREIGEILDIEESTSRSQYTRAKAMLEDMLIKKKILQKPKTPLLIASGGQ